MSNNIKVTVSGDSSQFNRSIDDAKRKIGNFGSELSNTRRKVRDYTAALENMSTEERNSALGGSLQRDLDSAKTKYQELARIQEKVNENLGRTPKTNISGNVTGNRALNGVTDAITSIGDIASGSADGVGILSGALSKLGPYGIAAGATVGAVGAIGTKAIDSAKELQTLDTNLGTLLGSASKGVELRKQLQKYGEATPYDTQGLAQASTTMLGYGVSAEKIMPTMKELGDVAMGNKEHLQSLALAFGQMNAAGKVTKGDLNQMANAGFGFDQIAKSMGISTGEFLDKLSKGQVTINDVSKALHDATSEGGLYYHSALNNSSTLDGVLSNMGESINNVFADLGSHLLEPATQAANGVVVAFEAIDNVVSALASGSAKDMNDTFGDFAPIVNEIIDGFNSFVSTVQNVINIVVDLVSGFVDVISKSGLLHDILSILADAFVAIEKFINMVVVAVKILVTWFNNAYNSSATFRTGINLLISPIIAVIKVVKQLVAWIKEAVSWLDKLINKEAQEQGINTHSAKHKTNKNTNTKTNTNTKVSTPSIPKANISATKTKTPKASNHTTKTKSPYEQAAESYNSSIYQANSRYNQGLDTTEEHNKKILSALENWINSVDKITNRTKSQNSLLAERIALYKKLKSEQDTDKITNDRDNAQKLANKRMSYGYYANVSNLDDVNKGADPNTVNLLGASKELQEAKKKYIDALQEIKNPTEQQIRLLADAKNQYIDVSRQVDKYTKLVESQKKAQTAIKNANKVQNNELVPKVSNDDFTTFDNIQNPTKGLEDSLNFDLSNTVDAINEVTEALKAAKEAGDDASEIELNDTLEDLYEHAKATGEALDDFYSKAQELDDISNFAGNVGNMVDQFASLAKFLNSDAKLSNKTAASMVVLGGALEQIGGNGYAAKVGAVMAAIGQILLGFAQASAQASSLGPFGWIAFLGAGLAAVATTIATVKGFNNGGIVQGNTTTGDNNIVRVNGGEMILNQRQQSNLFKQLNGSAIGGNSNVSLSGDVRVKGSDMYIAFTNYMSKHNKSL